MLEDIAILTKGQVASEELGVSMENISLICWVGCQVVIKKEECIIVDGAGGEEDVKAALPI